jgi:hypothetical protein
MILQLAMMIIKNLYNMTNIEIEEIKADLGDVLADWYLDKDIRKHYDIICKRISQLNEFIDTVPEQLKESEGYKMSVQLCYHFYRFRDEAS